MEYHSGHLFARVQIFLGPVCWYANIHGLRITIILPESFIVYLVLIYLGLGYEIFRLLVIDKVLYLVVC